MAAIGAAHRSPQSKSSLSKIQAVANLPPYSIVLNPPDIGLVDASLIDQILRQPADRIINQRRDNSRIQREAALEATGNVIFAAALPDSKFASMGDSVVARIKTQHHLAQGNQVPSALRSILDVKAVHTAM